MRKLFTFLSLLLFGCANAQSSMQTFMIKNEHSGVNTVMVDAALQGSSKFSDKPYLVVCGPYCKNMDKYGHQPATEVAKQDALLKTTNRTIASKTASIHAGSISGDKKKLNYYYVKDTAGLRTALQKLYKSKGQQLIFDIQQDANGSIYASKLSPGQARKDWAYNMGMITKLLQDGDKLNKPHKIHYKVYFRTEEGRHSFISQAQNKHYSIEKSEKQSQVLGYPYSVQISQTSLIRPDIITLNTQQLREYAANFDGRYDSWQTTVMLDRKNKKKKSPAIAKR